MHSLHANFLRVARFIHADLVRQAGQFDPIQLPEDQWCSLQRAVRSSQLAHGRGWHAAARRREEQMLREINDLESALARLTNQLQERRCAEDHCGRSRVVSRPRGPAERIRGCPV